MQLNLNDILGTTGLGGFRAGMSDNRALEMNNRELTSRDLANELARMKNQDFESETPLRAAERAKKLAEAEKLKAEMDSGTWDADRQRARAIQEQSLIKASSDNENTILERRVRGMQSIHTMFGGGMEVPEPMLVAGWDSARKIGKDYGFDIGDFNEQNKQKLVMRLRQTPQMAKLFETQRANAEKATVDETNHQQTMAVEQYKAGEHMRRTNAEIRGRLDQERLKQEGDGTEADPKSMTQQEARAWNKLIKFEDGLGPPPNEAEMILLETRTVAKEVKEILSYNPMLPVLQMQASQPGPKQAEAQAALQAEIAKARALSPTAQRLKAIKEGGQKKPVSTVSAKDAKKTIKRRGKKPDGREVIEYDDGTVYIEPPKATQ